MLPFQPKRSKYSKQKKYSNYIFLVWQIIDFIFNILSFLLQANSQSIVIHTHRPNLLPSFSYAYNFVMAHPYYHKKILKLNCQLRCIILLYYLEFGIWKLPPFCFPLAGADPWLQFYLWLKQWGGIHVSFII